MGNKKPVEGEGDFGFLMRKPAIGRGELENDDAVEDVNDNGAGKDKNVK